MEDVLEYISKDERDAIDDADFAGAGKSFPCDTQAHLDACATLLGKESPEKQAAIKAKAISIARRKGLVLPKSWQTDTKESADTPSTFSPKPRIATLTTRFLKDGAVSKNGRIYPKESVDKLIISASSPDAPLLTCFTSHDAADSQDASQLTGKVTKVWREGDEAYASFDIADTTTGRDMVSLIQGGYLNTMSLRAKNASLTMEKGYGMPVVGGPLQLCGIDFAILPGLEVATIQSVVTESIESVSITDSFDLDTTSLLLETEEDTMKANSHVAEQLKQRAATKAPPEPEPDASTQDVQENLVHATAKTQEAHDKLHEMCMGAKESGRTHSKATLDAMGAAHDAVAEALGIECRYDPDGDGDDDSTTDPTKNPDAASDVAKGITPATSTKEEETMTHEEMLEALKAQGYKVEAPKSEAEKLQEALQTAFEAKLAEERTRHDAELAAIRELVVKQAATQPAPQRQTLVEGANVDGTAPKTPVRPQIYTHGSYLKEKLTTADWNVLADRSAPYPEGVEPKYVLSEFQNLLSGIIIDRAGV